MRDHGPMSCEKIVLPSSRLRSVRACIIKHDCFYHIYWITTLFADNLSSVLCKKKMDCSFQGQGHCEHLNHRLFVDHTFSIPLISWQPNLVCWCTITNKPSATKWAYTGCNTVQLWLHLWQLTSGEVGLGEVFCHARQQTLLVMVIGNGFIISVITFVVASPYLLTYSMYDRSCYYFNVWGSFKWAQIVNWEMAL